MSLEDLPGTLASEAQQAVDAHEQAMMEEHTNEALKIEEKRIKSQERIAEREAERDERVAEIQSGAEQYRSILDNILARIEAVLNGGGTQNVTITPPESTETIEPSSEDITPPTLEENEENELGSVEEISSDTQEAANKTLENTEENVGIRNAGRGRGRRRR